MKRVLLLMILVLLVRSHDALGSVQTYLNDYSGFQVAGGAVHVIDFETLPNGNASHGGVQITSLFNYDLQGAHFSVPLGQLMTNGSPGDPNPFEGIGIDVIVPGGQRTWITADLTTPSTAIGVFFGGNTTLFCYSASGALLAQPVLGGGGNQFIGVVSDIPIARVVEDRQSSVSGMSAFLFTPVPEPATMGLCLAGAWAMRLRRVRRSR